MVFERSADDLVGQHIAFLDRVATRMVELDRGRLMSYPGNFARYQTLKEEQLTQEAVINAKADKLRIVLRDVLGAIEEIALSGALSGEKR